MRHISYMGYTFIKTPDGKFKVVGWNRPKIADQVLSGSFIEKEVNFNSTVSVTEQDFYPNRNIYNQLVFCTWHNPNSKFGENSSALASSEAALLNGIFNYYRTSNPNPANPREVLTVGGTLNKTVPPGGGSPIYAFTQSANIAFATNGVMASYLTNILPNTEYQYGFTYIYLYNIESNITVLSLQYRNQHTWFQDTQTASELFKPYFLAIPLDSFGSLGITDNAKELITGIGVYRRARTLKWVNNGYSAGEWGSWFLVKECLLDTKLTEKKLREYDDPTQLGEIDSMVFKIDNDTNEYFKVKRMGVVCQSSTGYDTTYLTRNVLNVDNGYMGWHSIRWGGSYLLYGIVDRGLTAVTYEDRNGRNWDSKELGFEYIFNVINNRYCIANISTTDIGSDGSRMLVLSNPGQFSFNLADNSVFLPVKPEAFASYSGRLFCFNESNTMIYDEINLLMEDHFKDIGAGLPNGNKELRQLAIDKTEEGLFWCDVNNCYMFDGKTIHRIGTKIAKSLYGSAYTGLDSAIPHSWQETTEKCKDNFIQTLVASKYNFVIFAGYEKNNGSNIVNMWLYMLHTKAWFFCRYLLGGGDFNNYRMTRDINGDILLNDNSNQYCLLFEGKNIGVSYEWCSKDLDLGTPYQKKRLHFIKTDPLYDNYEDGCAYPDITLQAMYPYHQTDFDDGSVQLKTISLSNVNGKYSPLEGRIVKLPYFHSLRVKISSQKWIQNISVIYRKLTGVR